MLGNHYVYLTVTDFKNQNYLYITFPAVNE